MARRLTARASRVRIFRVAPRLSRASLARSFAAMRLVLVALVAALIFAPDAHATRHCGLTPRVGGAIYDVYETHGNVPCRTVKRVVTRFLRDGTVTRPWACFRGHGSSPYAASCSRGKTVVRVYAPT